MDIRRALTIFRLEGRVPVDQLNTEFRSLVKKYHPDKLPDHAEWAHHRMSEINDAYETLSDWMAKAPETPRKRHPQKEKATEPGTSSSKTSATDSTDPMPGAQDREEFTDAMNRLLDGLGLYYQYGLDQPSYRSEGTRRFRHRESLRDVEASLVVLEEKASQRFRGPFGRAVNAMTSFARFSKADMLLGEVLAHPRNREERIASTKFRDARSTFNAAVKDILFPDLVPRHLRGRASAGLHASYPVFVLTGYMFTQGEEHDAAKAMANRYEAFVEVLECWENGLIHL